MNEFMDSNPTVKPEEKPTTHSDTETLTKQYKAHIQTGEPSLEIVLKYSNGSKRHFRNLTLLLNELSRNPEGECTQKKIPTKDYQKRELRAQALLRLRLWIDYGDTFTKHYKKKFGKKTKRKKLNENELVLRDISHLFSLAAFQLTPQEPFHAFLRGALDEIPGEYFHKQQIYGSFEMSPLQIRGEEVYVEPPLPASGEMSACDDPQKPKAKRKKPKSSSQSDHFRCSEASNTVDKQGPNSKVLPIRTRLDITAPIRRNSLTQKSRFVGSHFNSGNVDALFRHVKSSIPASRTINIQQETMDPKLNPKLNPIRSLVSNAHGQVLNDAPKKTNEEEMKGIFQPNDKPVRRRSSLVADALRALKRRDKK